MRPLTILNINTHEERGGAARVACSLHRRFLELGHDSWYAVWRKTSDDPRVFEVPNGTSAWNRLCRKASARLLEWRPDLARRVHRRLVLDIGQPLRFLNALAGREDFLFPGTRRILEFLPRPPDVILCHNLHGGYFDLRQLPRLAAAAPLVLSLHDAWLLAGHCAHSLGCPRWRSGCGQCPDIGRGVALRRDGSAGNWRRKRAIYARCRLNVVTPCAWLLDKVRQSMLAPSLDQVRVIPYGLDLGAFCEGERAAARERLGLPADCFLPLFVSNGIANNPWKDMETMRRAVARLAEGAGGRSVVFLGLGEQAPPEFFGGADIRYAPFVSDPARVADYYRAADVYLHAARADTFPNVVLEAQACGTPVVATAVSGIPEQVAHGQTGLLTPAGDPEAMAQALRSLMDDPELARRMGRRAAEVRREESALERMADDYLDVFFRAVAARNRAQGQDSPRA